MAASGDALVSLQGFLSEEEAKRALEQVGDDWEKLKWIFNIASSRVSDVEVQLKQAIAKADSANINAEQRYHEVENKYVAARKDANEAKNELDQLKNQQQSAKQREGNANATIRTLKEEKSVLDRQLVEAKKQLRKANEERDGAEKKCLQFIHELEQTKRQLQSKSEDIQSLSKAKNTLDEQFETYRKQEGSSIVSVRKFEEKLHAEEKHVQFLEAELAKQREQNLKQRQRDGDKIIQLRHEADESKREGALLTSKYKQASADRDSKEKKIAALRQELEESNQQSQEKESALHRQVELLNRMCRLHEDDSKDYKQKMEDTRALGRSLRQTIEKMAIDLKTERQANQNAMSHFQTEEKNLKQQLEDLRQELSKAQDEGARQGRKQALLDSKSTSDVLVLMTKHTGKEIVMDWYERLVEAENKLKQVQDEKNKLETHMSVMLKAWEEKAPVFKNLRRNYHKAIKSRAALGDRLSQAVKENERLTERLRGAKEKQGKLQTQSATLTQSLEDATQQVRKLLAAQSGVDTTASEGGDEDEVISKRLKVFKNIKELHDKNLQLLAIVRKLASGKDEEAAAAQALRDKKASEERAAFKRQVEEMVAARKKLMQHHQGVVEQRDMYKKMFLAQKDPKQVIPAADLAVVTATPSGSQPALASHVEFEKFKEEANRFKAETNRTISDQDKRIDTLVEEKSGLQEKLMLRTFENNRLSSENSRLKQQERGCVEDLAKERKYNKDLQKEIMNFRQDAKQKEIKVDDLNSKLKQTLQEKIRNETKLSIAEREKSELTQEKEKLKQEQAQYENLLKKMQSIEEGLMTQKNEEVAELQKQRDMLTKDVERQSKIADELRVEMLDMRTRHNAAASKQEDLATTSRKELTTTRSALSTCQEDLRTTTANLQETSKELEVLKAKNRQALDLTQTQLNVSDDKLENELAEQKKIVAKAQKDNKGLSTLIGALQANGKRCRELNDKLRADLKAAQQAAKDQAAKLNEEVSQAKQALQTQTQAAEAAAEKLRLAQKDSNDKITSLQAQITKLDEQAHSVSTELNQTKDQLNEKQHAISAAEARYRQEHVEHAKDLVEIENLRTSLKESQQMLLSAQQKCDEVQQAKDKLESLSAADQKQLRDLEKQLLEIKERHEQQTKHWMRLVEKLEPQQDGSSDADNARESALQLQRDEHRRNELLNMQIQNLKGELEKQKLETASQNKKIVQLTADLEVAHQAAKTGNDLSLEKQLDDARDQKVKADMAWHNLKGRNDQLEKREKELQNDKKQLELKMTPLTDQINKMEIKINNLEALRKAEGEERTNLRKRLQHMTNANSQWEGKKKLDEEMTQLKGKVKALETKEKQWTQERTKLAQKSSQEVAAAKKSTQDAAQDQIRRIVSKMKTARTEDKKKHQSAVEAHQKKVTELEEQLATAKQNQETSQTLVKKLHQKNSQYKKFLEQHRKRTAQAKPVPNASKASANAAGNPKLNPKAQNFVPAAKNSPAPKVATNATAAQKEQALRAQLAKRTKTTTAAVAKAAPAGNKPAAVAQKRKLAATSTKPVPKKLKPQATATTPAAQASAAATADKTDATKDTSDTPK